MTQPHTAENHAPVCQGADFSRAAAHLANALRAACRQAEQERRE